MVVSTKKRRIQKGGGEVHRPKGISENSIDPRWNRFAAASSTQFTETLSLCGEPGMGFGLSSVLAGIRAARDGFYKFGGVPDRHWTARLALAYEQADSRRFIGAQDVYSAVFGGVRIVRVDPFQPSCDGHDVVVDAEAVPYEPNWFSRCVVYAWLPDGSTHNTRLALETLFAQSEAQGYGPRFIHLCELGAAAIRSQDVRGLGEVVRGSRKLLFEEWGESADLIHPDTRKAAQVVQKHFGAKRVDWKPLGSGKASSILVVSEEAHDVLGFLVERGWKGSCARVNQLGLVVQIHPQGVRISLPCRIDLVGGGDLVADSQIGVAGACLAAAVNPCSEAILRRTTRMGCFI